MATSTERVRRFRERQRAALMPVDGPCPLPAEDQLGPAVETALQALRLGERDAAAAQLTRRTAAAIDQAANQASALRHLGPLLLASLEGLQATPASRPAPKPSLPAGPTRLDQLRAVRRNTLT